MITGGVVAGGKEAADKWMEEPESIATETDIMLLERYRRLEYLLSGA